MNQMIVGQIGTKFPRATSAPDTDKALWAELTSAMARLRGRSSRFWIGLRPRAGADEPWEWDLHGPGPAEGLAKLVDRAGSALADVARRLVLAVGPQEVLAAFYTDSGHFSVEIYEYATNASVRFMSGHRDLVMFVQSRSARCGDTEWDRALKRRTTRVGYNGKLFVLEPGVVWFTEWLEHREALTHFSCEGHPSGFHLIFSACRELADAIAEVGILHVEPILLESIPIPPGDTAGPGKTGLWTAGIPIRLVDYDTRDQILRDLSQRWSNIGYPSNNDRMFNKKII